MAEALGVGQAASESSVLQQKREGYKELCGWLEKARRELEQTGSTVKKERDYNEGQAAAEKLAVEIAEFERKPVGFSALAVLEAAAIRDAAFRSLSGDAANVGDAALCLARRISADSGGTVKPSSLRPTDFGGSLNSLLWSGNLLCAHSQFLRRTLTEGEGAERQLNLMREWFNGVTGREWGAEGWKPPFWFNPEQEATQTDQNSEFPRVTAPDPFPVSTFQPVGVASEAIGNQGWQHINDALASYATSGCGGLTSHVCLDIFPVAEQKSLGWVIESLKRGGASTFFRFLCSWVQESGGDITVSLDDLIREYGLESQDTEDRKRLQCKLWDWVCAFNYVCLRGDVAGKYRGRNGLPINAQEYHSLLRVCSVAYAKGDTSADRLPIRVTIEPAKWMREYLGVNPDTGNPILPSFGDMKRVTAIPEGQLSGRWARSILIGLSQLWRERAARPASAFPEGEFTFSREDVLVPAGLVGEVREILASSNPGRVLDYWRKAIATITEQGELGTYEEHGEVRNRKKGWKRSWLGQLVTARPNRKQIQGYGRARRSAAVKRREDAVRRDGRQSGD